MKTHLQTNTFKEKPVRDIMHPDDKTCEAWSKLTPNRLTAEQSKAVSD